MEDGLTAALSDESIAARMAFAQNLCSREVSHPSTSGDGNDPA